MKLKTEPNVETAIITARLNDHNSTSNSSCGIKFNESTILTTGLLLEPFRFLELLENANRLRKPWGKDRDSCHIYLTREIIEECKLKLPSFHATIRVDDSILKSNNQHGEFVELPCLPLLIWSCDLISDAMKTNLSDWEIGHRQSERNGQNHGTNSEDRFRLLSTFLLLKIDPSSSSFCNISAKLYPVSLRSELDDKDLATIMLELAAKAESANLCRGFKILSLSVPFLLKCFLNSWNEGIISNIIGQDDCLLLVDVGFPPDSHGSVLVSPDTSSKAVVGIVLTSNILRKGESGGFCLAVNFKTLVTDFLRRFLQNYSQKQVIYRSPNNLYPENRIRKVIGDGLDSCVALITTEQTWGSGVVLSVDPGLILTCSHVVDSKKNVSVTIGNCKSSAEVIFATPQGQIFDLALLAFKPNSSVTPIKIGPEGIKPGEAVFVVGYPFFKSIKPTISVGIVSLVSRSLGPILTSCCLHSGGSGAPLVRIDGSMVGIMTSFVCSAEESHNFPRMSLAISSTVFADVIKSFIRTKDKEVLLNLVSSDIGVNRLWTLDSINDMKSHL